MGGNFPEIPFTEVLKVFYLQFTELLQLVVVLRAPAKLLREKKKRKEKRASTG